MKKYYIIAFALALAVVVSGCTKTNKTNTNSATNTNTATNATINVNQAPLITKTPLVILTIAPINGKIDGGEDATITGQGFLTGAKVYFGSTEATGVTITSEKEIKVKTPKGQAGVTSVKVVNPDGKTALFKDSFTYK